MRRFFNPKEIIHFYSSLSLKSRIALLLSIGTLIPLIFTALFSYHTMSTILKNKLYSTFNSDLQQIRLTLENTINDMNYVSQQIYFSENIRYKLNSYLEDENTYERTALYNDINKELNLISFSNPNIGLSLIYIDNDDQYLFNSQAVKGEFTVRNEPMLIKGYKIDNFGPHISMERFNENYVLSTVRKLDIDSENDAYLYIESNLELAKDIIEIENVLNHTNYLLLNEESEIIYSENQEAFPRKSTFQDNSGGENYGTLNGFYWFKEQADRGWSVVSLISISQYKQEINQWIIWMVNLVILFVLISLIVGLLLWKTIYKPLNQFNHEIKLMSNNNFHSEIVRTEIPEFAKLTHHFRDMKKQIMILISEIKVKERNRADLEVEKLMHQINPHFLMNTLDTARWLSISGDRNEVTRLLSSLNKLLYYNMGKLGHLSTISEEIDSMEQYLQLQQIRYDFTYKINDNIDKESLNLSVPRFILQPLVENSIYHGLVDDGVIELTVNCKDNDIILMVSDNGRGMSKENIDKLLNEPATDQKRNGMGIGLNYVKRIMERTYGDQASIEIVSEINNGTTVILKIPMMR